MTHTVMEVLPPGLKAVLAKLPGGVRDRLEEIRVREGRPLEVIYEGTSIFVRADGTPARTAAGAYIPEREECGRLLDLLTRHSLYSFEEELRRGCITVAGGHRVGLAGRTVLEGGRVKLIRDIAGFNVRIARQIVGCAGPLLPYLTDDHAKSVHHTLIVSPPMQGKTTLIRDIVRSLSAGDNDALPRGGKKVGVIDERSEIAACVRGVPAFDMGPRTDVLDGCPKAEGMMMMIRSMSPDVLAVDELGTAEDAAAVREAMNAGIRLVATAHGRDLREVRARPALKELLDEALFKRFVILRRHGTAVEAAVYDERGTRLHSAAAGGPAHRQGVAEAGRSGGVPCSS